VTYAYTVESLEVIAAKLAAAVEATANTAFVATPKVRRWSWSIASPTSRWSADLSRHAVQRDRGCRRGGQRLGGRARRQAGRR